jgi:hypothetical protein
MVVLNSQLGASSTFSTSWVIGVIDLTFSTASQFAFSCIPHLLLIYFLLIYFLDQGLQLEAVPSGSLICANPNKHLSNVVAVDGIDLLVDVMRHPGYLRLFSRKAPVMYHIASAGGSDSTEYDSCDSPLEPNSPMYGVPDKLENEILVLHFLQLCVLFVIYLSMVNLDLCVVVHNVCYEVNIFESVIFEVFCSFICFSSWAFF